MNKHTLTIAILAALSAPAISLAAQAEIVKQTPIMPPPPKMETLKAQAEKARATPPTAQPQILPEKIAKERAANVFIALRRHSELLEESLKRVISQESKLKALGADVSAAEADTANATLKLEEVKKSITAMDSYIKANNFKDKLRSQAIRDDVKKEVALLVETKNAIVSAIAKLKLVKVAPAAVAHAPATPSAPVKK